MWGSVYRCAICGNKEMPLMLDCTCNVNFFFFLRLTLNFHNEIILLKTRYSKRRKKGESIQYNPQAKSSAIMGQDLIVTPVFPRYHARIILPVKYIDYVTIFTYIQVHSENHFCTYHLDKIAATSAPFSYLSRASKGPRFNAASNSALYGALWFSGGFKVLTVL